ncbi:restriction endonuclease, SacI family [Sphingomonas sp. SAFR-052]|uniref:restriction endonuclease, SacI family n=1 Tax=Sphingomonas sp. SAFR-052 TaxID=3436867 RepID=UPI003F802973
MTPDEIIDDLKANFALRRPRTYTGGLLPAFCDFLLDIDSPSKGWTSYADMIATHPLLTEGTSTLTITWPDAATGQKTIRPAYNAIHHFYIFENKRLGYPRSEPYATGKWADFIPWLDSLVTFTAAELAEVRDRAKAFVLETLPETKFDPSTVVVDPPIFRILIEKFGWTERRGREPTGAAFQALVFAYIRADAPHLQVETRKVRTGGARVKGIGDIDAFEGERLTISAEVKAFRFAQDDLEHTEHFITESLQRGALGLIVAIGFVDGVANMVRDRGVIPVTPEDLLRTVALWDPVKQRAALNAFEWAIVHKEQSPDLIGRYRDFLEEVGYRKASVKEELAEEIIEGAVGTEDGVAAEDDQ